jgi:hypothetical protein
MPVIPALGRLRQEVLNSIKANLGYIAKPCLKKSKGWGCSSVVHTYIACTRPWVLDPQGHHLQKKLCCMILEYKILDHANLSTVTESR